MCLKLRIKPLITLIFFLVSFSSYAIADEATDLNNNIVAYYKMQNTTFTYADSSSNLIHQINGNTPDQEDAMIDKGQDFEFGNDDHIVSSADADLKVNDIFVCLWVKAESNAGTSNYIISTYGSTSGWDIRLRNSGDVFWFVVWDGDNYEYSQSDGTTVDDNTWYHVCAWYDSTNTKGYIWVNNDLQGSDTGGNGGVGISYPANTYLSIGGYYNGGSWNNNEFDGVIDEIYYGDMDNTTITTSVKELVNFLYNSGSPTSSQQYPMSGGVDSTPPVMNLTYPVNTTHYNNFTGNITINATDNVAVDDCDINNTNFNKLGVSGDEWAWNWSDIPNGNYSIFANCSDTSGNSDNITFWFVVDLVDPTSTLVSPTHLSSHNTHIPINVTYSDTYLYRTNTTIYAPNSTILFTNYSGNLGGSTTSYTVIDLLNVTTLPDGVYTLFREATDTHTANNFDEILNYTIETRNGNTKYTYHLSKGDIEFSYPEEINLTTIVNTDRWRQFYTYNNQVIDEVEIEIEAEQMVYLSDSIYNCHLILYDSYWFDCEGLDIQDMNIINNKAIFKYYPESIYGDMSDSLGGLNYVNWTTSFVLDTSGTYVTNSTILTAYGNETLNCSKTYAENSTFYILCNELEEDRMIYQVAIWAVLQAMIFAFFYKLKSERNHYIAGFLTVFASLALIILSPASTYVTAFSMLGIIIGVILIMQPRFRGI